MDLSMPFVETECEECGKLCYRWCKACQVKEFRRKFNDWSSGNIAIDQLIQNTQLNASEYKGYLEWIPPESVDINEQVSEGAFSTILSGTWLEGPRWKWDEEDNSWHRSGPLDCALKRIEDSNNISQEYLDNGDSMVECFGITRDPETGCYMFVVRLCNENLYQLLKRTMGRLAWKNRICMLYEIANGLKQIHDCGLYHGNLHGGNLLTEMTTNGINIRISDTGLHGLRPKINENIPDIYSVLMTRCWHQDPKQRPNIAELCNILSQFALDMRDNTSSISKQFSFAHCITRGASKYSFYSKGKMIIDIFDILSIAWNIPRKI
ncbi:9623_t:CDS:2 [Cetraspora pellucida]|uniref:9623_t:CDS:1 n=1 Tax=Cetraspora pellucida TaxID=1433469 RepID=A0A9N9FHS0_9GLOM|nr:9623_t:CDS:2 [Cetraspora pellucida]